MPRSERAARPTRAEDFFAWLREWKMMEHIDRPGAWEVDQFAPLLNLEAASGDPTAAVRCRAQAAVLAAVFRAEAHYTRREDAPLHRVRATQAKELRDLPAFFAQDGYSDYVIEGVLPIGVTVVYGPTGTGKTGFAVATAMAVAAGPSWAGRNVINGAVLYAASEDIDGVKKRFHAAAISGGVHELPVHRTDEAVALADRNEGIAPLVKNIDELGIAGNLKLIVVDTLARSFGPFSQDDATHAASFMGNVATLSKRYGCAVLVLHHTAKSGSDMRASRSSRTRPK